MVNKDDLRTYIRQSIIQGQMKMPEVSSEEVESFRKAYQSAKFQLMYAQYVMECFKPTVEFFKLFGIDLDADLDPADCLHSVTDIRDVNIAEELNWDALLEDLLGENKDER